MPEAPFGDIFSVQTPALDRLTQQLYTQQQQRQLQLYQANQSLQDEFKKDVGNIRTADLPEFTDAYNQYRDARIKMLRTPMAMMNRKEYLQQQQDANEKLAKAYSILNDSVAEKTWENNLGQRMNANWKNYADNAWENLKQRRNIPASQLPNSPLYGEDAFVNKDNYDFGKILDNSFGKQKTIPIDETKYPTDPKAPQPLQKTIMNYTKFSNNPFDAQIELMNHLTDSKMQNSFIKKFSFDPEIEKQIENRFNNMISDPKYQQVYGLKGDEHFFNEETDLGKAAKMAIMLGAKKLPPATEMPRQPQITENVMNKRQGQALQRIEYSGKIYGLTRGIDPVTTEGNADRIISKDLQDAQNNNGVVSPNARVFKTLFGRTMTPRDVVKMTPDKTYQVFKKQDDGKGNITLVPTNEETNYEKAKTFLVKDLKSGLNYDNPEPKTSDYSNVTSGKDKGGNKITIGYKNGKWFDIKTGKEYK